MHYPGGARAAYTVTPDEAKQMNRAGVSRPCGRGRTYRAIELYEGPSRPVAGTKYSDNREHADNPRGAWRLRPLPINHEDPNMRLHVFICFRHALVQCGAEVAYGK